ncbi:MAG: DUF4412 domain-containing protein [Gemmatimonadaceae bacterium]
MRRIVALSLFGLVAATPLAAQFEGTVNMKMSAPTGGGTGEINMKISVKGDRSATVMSMPASSGPMAGMEIHSIFDPKANTMTTLMPMIAGMANIPGMQNAKGLKTVVDLSKAGQMSAGRAGATGAVPEADIKKLGTSETIAGMSCDDYEITSNGQPMRMCMTSALGRFTLPQMGGGMGRGGATTPPAWSRAFGSKPMFPLKVWSTDGKMAMEVTSVQKGSVPESMFEIPDGYVDMAAMMGGMGRPPKP